VRSGGATATCQRRARRRGARRHGWQLGGGLGNLPSPPSPTARTSQRGESTASQRRTTGGTDKRRRTTASRTALTSGSGRQRAGRHWQPAADDSEPGGGVDGVTGAEGVTGGFLFFFPFFWKESGRRKKQSQSLTYLQAVRGASSLDEGRGMSGGEKISAQAVLEIRSHEPTDNTQTKELTKSVGQLRPHHGTP
jgi:hypothetical protein